MSEQDRVRWDTRYQSATVEWTPAPLVVAHAPLAIPGALALDVACGAGRHALHLASLGYTVDPVDISNVALNILAHEAQRRGLDEYIRPIHADLDTWRPVPAHYDLITQIAFFDRARLPSVMAAVKPDGLLIIEAFNIRRLTTHPGFNPAYVLQDGELAAACSGFDILYINDQAGDHADRSQLVAKKRLLQRGVVTEQDDRLKPRLRQSS